MRMSCCFCCRGVAATMLFDVSLIALLGFIFTPTTQSKMQLRSAVDTCLELSADDCPNGPHGLIGKWSTWTVCFSPQNRSTATSRMGRVERDQHDWNVPLATSFNRDISKWDVSSVDNMDYMFGDKTLFKRKLYGAGWIYLKASKTVMLAWSSGSISHCVATTPVTIPVFSPQSRAELKSAVDKCLKLGEYSDGPHGPIGEWDVSRVIDMSQIFSDANSFNGDISKQKCL